MKTTANLNKTAAQQFAKVTF